MMMLAGRLFLALGTILSFGAASNVEKKQQILDTGKKSVVNFDFQLILKESNPSFNSDNCSEDFKDNVDSVVKAAVEKHVAGPVKEKLGIRLEDFRVIAFYHPRIVGNSNEPGHRHLYRYVYNEYRFKTYGGFTCPSSICGYDDGDARKLQSPSNNEIIAPPTGLFAAKRRTPNLRGHDDKAVSTTTVATRTTTNEEENNDNQDEPNSVGNHDGPIASVYSKFPGDDKSIHAAFDIVSDWVGKEVAWYLGNATALTGEPTCLGTGNVADNTFSIVF